MRRKFTVLSLLSVLVIALGIALPAYMNRDQPVAIGGPFHTPRPTSTQFLEPLREIVQIVEAEESETNDDITNCTYPLYYWKDYPDSWPAQIVIAGLIYTQADMFEIYHDPDPDTATLLIRQLYTAFLNILGGSSHARIDPVIVDANNWLATNPPGAAISEHNQSIGMNLAASLEDYNDGLNGPPACQDVPPPPTPTPTITETQVPTWTPTPTNTPVPPRVISTSPSNNQPAPPGAPSQPTATQALPTALLPSPTLILVLPTAAPSPTLVLLPPTAAPTPTLRPVIPTATNPPPPTLGPVIPTATNTPAPTLRPVPTATNPPPPPSTNTPSPAPTSTLVVPTSTFTPLPTSAESPPTPTITDTDTETGELLPTRNPNYASPTPATPP
jgi:hypothetical protein